LIFKVGYNNNNVLG